jgi:hypothetical protein
LTPLLFFYFHPQGENKKIKGVQGASPLPGSGGARGFSVPDSAAPRAADVF